MSDVVLSIENYNKLNENYLYQREPMKHLYRDMYHCKNWTFKVDKCKNSKAYMLDTYYESYDSHYIEVTDDNIDDFKFVFDFREVEKIKDKEIDEYNDEDLFCVPTGSGGTSCGRLHWIVHGTEKSKQLLIDKAKQKISSLEQDLRWAKNNLEELLK